MALTDYLVNDKHFEKRRSKKGGAAVFLDVRPTKEDFERRARADRMKGY
jgi:hypothetical protein